MNQVIKPPNLAPVDPAALPMPWVNAPGFATKDGAPLDLVTLADVVRWLIPSKRMHFIPAVLALHKALAGIDGLVLYVTDQLGGARVVGDSETFGLDTPRQGRRVISAGIGGGRVPAKPAQSLPDGVTPGTSAALYLVRRECGRVGDSDSVMASINEMLSFLAMTCDQAAMLWGAGVAVETETVTPQASAKQPKVLVKDMAPEWGGERLLEKQKELKNSGAKDFTNQLSNLSGLEGTEVRRRIKAYKESVQNPWNGLRANARNG